MCFILPIFERKKNMQYLFVASGSILLFIILLILSKKNKLTSDYLLIIWLSLFVIHFITLFIIVERNSSDVVWQMLILEFSETSVFLHGPLFLLYYFSLTKQNFNFQKNDLIHFIPFILSYSYFLKGILVSSNSNEFIVRNVLLVLKMLSLFIYIIVVLRKLRQHHVNVENIFSNTEEKYLDWFSFLGWGIISILIISLISLSIERFTSISIPQLGGLYSNIALSLFAIMIGYFGFKQETIFSGQDLIQLKEVKKEKKVEEVMKVEFDTTKYKKSGLEFSKSKDIHKELLNLFEREKPFLEPDLTLYSLSKQMNVKPNHLSQVINSLEEVNFFDFVNQYRIKLASDKIKEGLSDSLTMLGIAFECGFNSKASFNRAFKKFTGLTPTEFKNRNT